MADRQVLAEVISRYMVRRRHTQLSLSQVVLFGLVLPEPETLMEPRLRAVDKVLQDEDMLDSMTTVLRRRWRQSARCGRPGTPAEVALRMLVLKHLRKNTFGMKRTRYRGRAGLDRMKGWAAIANNLVALGRYAAHPSP